MTGGRRKDSKDFTYDRCNINKNCFYQLFIVNIKIQNKKKGCIERMTREKNNLKFWPQFRLYSSRITYITHENYFKNNQEKEPDYS